MDAERNKPAVVRELGQVDVGFARGGNNQVCVERPDESVLALVKTEADYCLARLEWRGLRFTRLTESNLAEM